VATSKYLAELLGTFILVFVGSMTIVSAKALEAPILVVVPAGFGLGLLVAIMSVGGVSGGHFNPAVTLGALLDRRITPVNAVGYAIAQVIGAIAASALVLILSSQAAVQATANGVGANVSELQAFVLEVVLTALFIHVILRVTSGAPERAPMIISLTLVAIHLAGIPTSGASVNPARSLGPALVGGNLGPIWIYLTAPFIGAVLGWALFRGFTEATD
jgi:aquaporin Z